MHRPQCHIGTTLTNTNGQTVVSRTQLKVHCGYVEVAFQHRPWAPQQAYRASSDWAYGRCMLTQFVRTEHVEDFVHRLATRSTNLQITNCPISGHFQSYMMHSRFTPPPLKYLWNGSSYSRQILCACSCRLCQINQSISMNLLWRPTSKALGRQKYNENTTASQCHNNDSAKR